MIRTQGSDHGYVPHSELVAARSVLAGKVSVPRFAATDK